MYPNSRPILPPCPEDKIFCGDAPFPIPRDPRTGCGCPQGMRPTFAFGSKIPDKQDPNSINNLYENPLEFYSSNKVHNINRINQGERWDNNFNIPRLPPKSNIKTNAPQSSNNVSFANGQSATTVGENIVVSDKIFPLDSSTIEQCTPPPVTIYCSGLTDQECVDQGSDCCSGGVCSSGYPATIVEVGDPCPNGTFLAAIGKCCPNGTRMQDVYLPTTFICCLDCIGGTCGWTADSNLEWILINHCTHPDCVCTGGPPSEPPLVEGQGYVGICGYP